MRAIRSQNRAGRWFAVGVTVVMVVTGASAARGQSGDRPPEPSFDQPVNYVAWYAQFHYQPSWPKGEDVYSMLWSSEASEQIKIPGGELFGQLQIAARQPWQPSERADLEAYLSVLENEIQAFMKASETPNVRWHVANHASDWLLDETRRENASIKPVWHALIPAVMAHGWRVGPDGGPQFDRLLAAWRAGLRYARHVQTSGGAVAYMTNGAVRSIVYMGIRNGLTLNLFDAEQIGRIRALIEAEDGAASLSDAYKFEWMGLLDLMQRMYPAGEFSKPVALELDQTEIAGLDPRAFPEAIPTALGIDTYFQQFIRVAAQPWSLMAVEVARKSHRARVDIAGNNPVLRFYLPDMAYVYEFGIQLETERRAVQLLLALAEQQRKSGNWPVSLQGLIGEGLAVAKTDPLTFPLREFGYRVVKGDPKLYTAGFDGDDDRGEHDRQWSRGKTGKDFVFFPSQQLAE